MAIYEAKKPTKDGRKYYFSCYYKDKYGTRKKYKSKKYLGKRECEKAERKFLEETEYRDLTDYGIMFEDVFNEWLEYKRAVWKDTSYYRYKKTLGKRILKYFERYKLHSIKTTDINNWKAELLKEQISKDYVNKLIGSMKEILEYAVNNYSFDSKVAYNLQKTKLSTIEKIRESTWNYITYEEYQRLIEATDDKLYKYMFEFLYYTGLRITEFIALTWNDIDLKRKTVKINKILTLKIDYAKYDVLSPKTTNSVRIIDLPDNVIKTLTEHKKEEEKIYNFNNNMFVFGNIDYIKETTFRNHLNKYIKKAKIKPKKPNYKEGDTIFTPHGFRHSQASLLINLGLDIRDVAERLGDTPRVVESTYYHIFPQKKSNTVNALNKLNREP